MDQKSLHCANCEKSALSFLFFEKKYYCPTCFMKIYTTMNRLGAQFKMTINDEDLDAPEPWENKS